MFRLLYHPRSIKFLSKLPQKELRRIISEIEALGKNPFSSNLHVRKLTTTKQSYRLRVGTVRVIFELNPQKKIIYLHDIDFRGNIY